MAEECVHSGQRGLVKDGKFVFGEIGGVAAIAIGGYEGDPVAPALGVIDGGENKASFLPLRAMSLTPLAGI